MVVKTFSTGGPISCTPLHKLEFSLISLIKLYEGSSIFKSMGAAGGASLPSSNFDLRDKMPCTPPHKLNFPRKIEDCPYNEFEVLKKHHSDMPKIP